MVRLSRIRKRAAAAEASENGDDSNGGESTGTRGTDDRSRLVGCAGKNSSARGSFAKPKKEQEKITSRPVAVVSPARTEKSWLQMLAMGRFGSAKATPGGGDQVCGTIQTDDAVGHRESWAAAGASGDANANHPESTFVDWPDALLRAVATEITASDFGETNHGQTQARLGNESGIDVNWNLVKTLDEFDGAEFHAARPARRARDCGSEFVSSPGPPAFVTTELERTGSSKHRRVSGQSPPVPADSGQNPLPSAFGIPVAAPWNPPRRGGGTRATMGVAPFAVDERPGTSRLPSSAFKFKASIHKHTRETER